MLIFKEILKTTYAFILISLLAVCAVPVHASNPNLVSDASNSHVAKNSVTVIDYKNYQVRSNFPLNVVTQRELNECFNVYQDLKLDPWQAGRLAFALEQGLKLEGYHDVHVNLNSVNQKVIFDIEIKTDFYPVPHKKDVLSLLVNKALEQKSVNARGAALRNRQAQEEKLYEMFLFRQQENKDKIVVNESLVKEQQTLPSAEIEELTVDPSQIEIKGKLEKPSLEQNEANKIVNPTSVVAVLSQVQAFSLAKDKEEYLLNSLNSYVNSSANRMINDALNSYSGVNAQISLGLQELHKIQTSGKIVVPLYKDWKTLFPYAQAGFTVAPNSRYIAHAALGLRFYPEAKDLANPGSFMFGVNTVFDYDLSRQHKRMSIGLEYMTNSFLISANYYQRLSGWRSSYDFEHDYVQERPANGFDIRTKWFVPSEYAMGRLSLNASITHWFGKDVSAFGSKSLDDLEDDPWVYALGATWQPVPALSVDIKQEMTGKGRHNSSVGINFNLPLDDYSVAHAFDPNAVNLGSGFDLVSSRSMFIDRDYNMPLQYRATPGKYHIEFCGYSGNQNERLCFFVKDGLNRAASNIAVTVKSDDRCVVFDNNGNYVSDTSGHVYATILESCVAKSKVTVSVADSSENFTVDIKKITMTIKASPTSIQRHQSSNITLSAKSSASAGTKVTWQLQGTGSLSATSSVLDSNGKSTIVYYPDTTQTKTYNVTVVAIVAGAKFAANVEVKVFGINGFDIDAGAQDDTSYIEGTEVRKITYKDLQPGSKVKFDVSGDGKLSAKSDGSEPQSNIELTVDENGEASLYVVADNVDSGSINIKAVTEDVYTPAATAELTVRSYIPTITVPASAEVGDPFTLIVSNLKKGTTLTWSDSSFATHADTETSVDDNGKSQIVYTVLGDKWTGDINDITFTYYRNVHTTMTANVPSVTIKEYTPNFDSASTTFSGSDSITVTLLSGKPGQTVSWSVTNGSLSNAQTVFDSEGKATATLTGTSPYTGEAVITTQSMGKTQTYNQVYKIYTLGFTSFTTTNSTYHDTRTDTMDYRTSQVIEVTGGKPNTNVTVYTDNTDVNLVALNDNRKPGDINNGVMLAGPGNVASQSFTLDESGKGTFEVQAIDNFAVTNFTVTASYYKNSAEVTTTTKDVAMYDYQLSVSSTSANICGNDTDVVTVTGGRAGEAVNWTVTNGSLSNAQAVFDADGKATATLTGAAPYSGSVSVGASGVNKSASTSLTYLNYTLSINSFNTTNSTYHNVVTDTMDYRSAQTIYVSGGKPNSTVSLSTNDGRVSLNTSQITLDANGNGSFNVNAVNDFAVDNFTINATYEKNSAETAETNKYVNLYDYNLNMTTDKTEIYGDDTFTITVTGGRAGEAVAWNLTGDGQYTSASNNFDGNGNAYATVKGMAPFATNITVTSTLRF